MMNVIAVAMLLSSLGSVMVLSPEPMLVMSSQDGESPLQAAKEAAHVTFLKVEETAGAAKDTLVKGAEVLTKPVEKSVGWFRRKPKPEDHLAVAKEKAALAKEAMQEAGAQLKGATMEKAASAAEAAKEKAADAFHETGKYVSDKTSQAAESAKHAAGTAEERTEDAAHAVYKKVGSMKDATYDAAAAAKDKAETTLRRAEWRAKEAAEVAYDSAAETFGSAKEKTYEKAGGARDTIYDAAGYVKEKLHDMVVGAKDEVYDAGVAAKDRTAGAAEYANDKVNEGAESARDAVADSVQSGVDKTKGTATDAAEKLKESGEHAVHETTEAGHGILGRVKDAACKTAECIRARAQEAGSFLPNLGQGVGYAYNDRSGDGGDIAGSVKQTANDAAETVGEIGEDAKTFTRDSAHAAKNSARRSYDAAKDKVGYYAGEKYDSARDTTREYIDEAGRRYRSAREYNDEPSHYYRGRGRQHYRNARDAPGSRSYYDAVKDEAEDYYDGIKDRTRHAYRGVKDRAGEYYDDVRDRAGGYIPDRHHDSSPRDYYSAARQRVADGYQSARDTAEDYYESAKFRPGNDLAAVVESMGYRRVAVVPADHVTTSSSKEIVIGDVKYVWQGKGQAPSHETVFNRVSKTVKSAAHTVGERLGLAKEHVKEGNENLRDAGVRAKDQAYETAIRSPRDRRVGRSWGDRPNHPEFSEDDSIVSRGVRNVKGGVRGARQAYESQRSKVGDYADRAQQELSNFAGHSDDHKSCEGGRAQRTWKDILFRRPVGVLLALTRALHLFTFSTVYGSAFWVTFVSGLILSKHIPRQQFGYVQSRMFPVYLRILAVGQSILFLLHFIMHPWFSADSIERWQLCNFALMIASTLINAYVLEPRATKVMFERLKVEKEEGRGLDGAMSPMDAKQFMEDHKKKLVGINNQFKALHGYSSALNLISLGGLTCHLWHLAHRLVI